MSQPGEPEPSEDEVLDAALPAPEADSDDVTPHGQGGDQALEADTLEAETGDS